MINQHKELGLDVQNQVLEHIKQIREPKLDISAYTLERQDGFEQSFEDPVKNSEDEDYGHDESEIVYQISNPEEEEANESS